VSDVTISVQQERSTKLEFVKLQVMVQKQAWSYLGKKDNCTLWNYCNNLYITYIVLKLGESTGMLISVRMLRATIESYYLSFRSFYTVYDIKLLLHHGFAVIRANYVCLLFVQHQNIKFIFFFATCKLVPII
jgi:hypothetical protein